MCEPHTFEPHGSVELRGSMENHPCVSGPAQFRPLLFKGPLYTLLYCQKFLNVHFFL